MLKNGHFRPFLALSKALKKEAFQPQNYEIQLQNSQAKSLEKQKITSNKNPKKI
jgi:hypothetical protein